MNRYSLIPYFPVPNLTDIAKELALKENGTTTMSDMLHQQMQGIMKNLHQQQMDGLEMYIKGNLERLGYTFVSQEEFLEFMKDRVTRVQFIPGTANFELYLDFDVATKKGLLIGSYSQELKINHQVDKITYTLG